MRKKILFLTAFVPNPAAAAEKNTMIMLEEMGQYFDIDLVYFKYKGQKAYKPTNSNINVVRVYNNSTLLKLRNILALPIYHPMFTVRFSKSTLKDLQNIINNNQYAAIVTEHSQMFIYSRKLKFDSVKILYVHDVMAQRVDRSSNKLFGAFCRYSEKKHLKLPNSYIFAISKKDADLLRNIYGINSKYALAYIESQVKAVIPTEIKDEYCFIGKWTRADNLDGVIWFYKTVVPFICKPITVNIIGKNFPEDKIECRNPMVKTKFVGFVDNPYPLIARCRAMFAPLFTGAGVKQKVFESLACGTPVIGTEIAFEGLPEKYSNMMLLANDVDSYLKAMEVDIPVEERCRIKKEFIEDYTSETIPQFLNKLLEK